VRRSKALIAAVAAATVTDESGASVDLSDLIGSTDEAGADEAEADENGDDADGASEADPDAVETTDEPVEPVDVPAADEPGATEADAPVADSFEHSEVQPEGGRTAAPTA